MRFLYLLRGGQLTNASVVLFAREPRFWAPNLALRITSYAGDARDSIVLDTVFEGPAVKLVREAVAIIQQRTGFAAQREAGKLERQDLRPVRAARGGW